MKEADSERLASRLAEISARRKRLQIDIDDRTVRSPIDGVVGRTFVIAGEHVDEGQRLLSLHDPSDIWVQANIRETDLGRVEVGQAVRITVDAYPDEALTGRVERIGRAANSEYALLPRLNEAGTFTKVTQRIELRIGLEDTETLLKPGMMVVVDIEAPRPAPGRSRSCWSSSLSRTRANERHGPGGRRRRSSPDNSHSDGPRPAD